MTERKIKSGRYRKRADFCLDYDSGGYTNTFTVFDGDKNTGISVSDSGHAMHDGSHKRTVVFEAKEFPTLRDAIFAYEDSLKVEAS